MFFGDLLMFFGGTSPLDVADRLAEIAIFTLASPFGALRK